MPQVITAVQRRFESADAAVRTRLRRARARWRWFDHLARAYERYRDRRGDRLAAALTSYGFLSFFPLLALAYALLGYLVGVSDLAREYLVTAINDMLPGLSDRLQISEVVRSKTAAGLIGTVGLLLTGLGWVQVLRESLRDIWGNDPRPEGANFLVMRLLDAAVLVFLGVMLILGSAATAVAGSTAHTVLGWFGMDDVSGAGTALRLLSLGVAVFFNTWIFLVLFSRLTGTRAPWRRIYKGALLGAVGFEALKQVASFLLGRTVDNPLYASFAVLVGLMVWINLVSRYLFYVAAWTATRSVVLSADNGHRTLTPGDVLSVIARPVGRREKV
ncbi:inner membrane protein YhjD [Actinomadura kijaniata]|uniref:Membrane protein n=1 Tax=Actinomadura namibiensis TaxID=182080 RepID=A0A7W3LUI8_ACTNM|nr:YhjD/YihY/BrkB family envelope integrity protein [Actinomadura namibiensis]MBA8954544.1 membrane protein [Actinomadura namibiensis]